LDGYNIEGWYYNQTLTTPVEQSGGRYILPANKNYGANEATINLYAKVSKVRYVIQYKHMNGSEYTNLPSNYPTSFTVDDTIDINALGNPARSADAWYGMTFQGWGTIDDNEVWTKKTSIVGTAPVTLYAKYTTAITYQYFSWATGAYAEYGSGTLASTSLSSGLLPAHTYSVSESFGSKTVGNKVLYFTLKNWASASQMNPNDVISSLYQTDANGNILGYSSTTTVYCFWYS
jgi:hypothetical protein